MCRQCAAYLYLCTEDVSEFLEGIVQSFALFRCGRPSEGSIDGLNEYAVQDKIVVKTGAGGAKVDATLRKQIARRYKVATLGCQWATAVASVERHRGALIRV